MKYLLTNALFLTTLLFYSPASAVSAGIEKGTVSPGNEQRENNLEEAKNVYFDYYKDSKNLDRSIGILEEILEKDPENLEALLLLSRVWLTYGYAKASNNDEKSTAFKNGFEAARRALEIAPDDPDAHFYHVANLGSWAETRGVIRSLFLLPKIRGGIEKILELDPKHVYGLAMYGLLYYSLPGFLGGDLRLSEIYLKRAIGIDPHMSTLKIHLAKTLIKQRKYDEAKDTLREIIEEKNPTFYADWYLNRKVAARMMVNIEKLEKKSDFNLTSLSSTE
jgi:tetratricopeptide (TPR) repeat protein